jgi:cytochrome c peroxidase
MITPHSVLKEQLTQKFYDYLGRLWAISMINNAPDGKQKFETVWGLWSEGQKRALAEAIEEFERKVAPPHLQRTIDAQKPNLEQWEAEAVAVIEEVGREVFENARKK